MKVKLKPIKSYIVTINGKDYRMDKVNEMAGMVHLKTESGQDLVISKESHFSDILEHFGGELLEVDVVKISPSLTE